MTDTAAERILIYRLDLSAPLPETAVTVGLFETVMSPWAVLFQAPRWIRHAGPKEAVKMALKIASGRRIFFYVTRPDLVIHSGWANIGFCRHYPVEKDAVVLSTLETRPDYQGRGLGSAALRKIMNRLYQKGYRRFYIDALTTNKASQRMIQKAGFPASVDNVPSHPE